MCYRYVLQKEALEVLAERLAAPGPTGWQSRYNLAPGASVPVLRAPAARGGPSLEIVNLRWGLLPAWAKEEKGAKVPANARAETVARLPIFREAFRRRRCLVPAGGFYEWRGQEGSRHPYFFSMRDGTPLCFAGLWESWCGCEGGPPVETCAIITVPPNGLIRPIHDRMPAILTMEEVGRWLDPRLTESSDLECLLHPFSAEAMIALAVTDRVNNARFDDLACLEPPPAPPEGGAPDQLSLGL